MNELKLELMSDTVVKVKELKSTLIFKKWTHSSVSVHVNVTSLWYFPSLEINRFHFGAYVMLPLLHYYLGKLKSLQYALLNSVQS